MYCANNQLTYSIFLTADPATVNIFKSASTLVTAAIACILLGRYVTWVHWATIVLQVSGLFITQFDACKDRMVLPVATYILLLIAVTISEIMDYTLWTKTGSVAQAPHAARESLQSHPGVI